MTEILKVWEKKDALLKRFGLENGMCFEEFKLKNQIWKLDGFQFGFGDLREIDIVRIKYEIREGEVFEGFNENHGSEFQSRSNPMIVITKKSITYPKPKR